MAATEFAGDVDLTPERADIVAVRSALQEYAIALAALWPALTARDDARSALSAAQADHASALEHLTVVMDEQQETQDKAVAARERYETLESTVGVAVQELQRRLDEVAHDLAERDRAETRIREAEASARSRHGNAEGRRDALSGALASIEDERRSAIESLRTFAGTGLLQLACPEVEIPDPTAAGRGRLPGRTQQVADLSAALDEEIAERDRVLSARHREILENQLVSEVAASLQELVSAAEVQVAE